MRGESCQSIPPGFDLRAADGQEAKGLVLVLVISKGLECHVATMGTCIMFVWDQDSKCDPTREMVS